MSGKDLIDSVKARQPDHPGARRPAARGLQLRALPRRGGPEDLQVQGQRPHGRGVAGLRAAGEPGAFHVPEAARRQAALLRRHPAHGRRLPDLPRPLRTGAGAGAARLENPVWHIHDGKPPARGGSPLSFALLLNLASCATAEDPAVLWGFISRYAPDASPGDRADAGPLVDHAIAYYRDFVRPKPSATAAPDDHGAGRPRGPAGRARGAAGRGRRRGDPEPGLRGRQAPSHSRSCASWFKALYEILLRPGARARAWAPSWRSTAWPRAGR